MACKICAHNFYEEWSLIDQQSNCVHSFHKQSLSSMSMGLHQLHFSCTHTGSSCTNICGFNVISFVNSFNDWLCTCGGKSIWTIWIYFQFKFRYKHKVSVWNVLICSWFYYFMTELYFFLSTNCNEIQPTCTMQRNIEMQYIQPSDMRIFYRF